MAIPKKKTPLALWLKTNNRTQLWLADRLDISTAQANRLVRGLNMPRAELALRIQDVTGVTVEQLAKARASNDNTEARIRHGESLIARGTAIIEAATAATK